MLSHDEIRVDEHVERYTRSDVAQMWKSYRATGMGAMDEKSDSRKGVEGAPTMDELFPGAK